MTESEGMSDLLVKWAALEAKRDTPKCSLDTYELDLYVYCDCVTVMLHPDEMSESFIQAAIREAVAEVKGEIDTFSGFAEYDDKPIHHVKIYNRGSMREIAGSNLTVAMLKCWLMVLGDL